MVIEIVSRGAWRLPRVRVWPGTVQGRIDALAPLIVRQARSEAGKRAWKTRREKWTSNSLTSV